eukprot:3941382-Rhodomonas_salina.1
MSGTYDVWYNVLRMPFYAFAMPCPELKSAMTLPARCVVLPEEMFQFELTVKRKEHSMYGRLCLNPKT